MGADTTVCAGTAPLSPVIAGGTVRTVVAQDEVVIDGSSSSNPTGAVGALATLQPCLSTSLLQATG